MSASEWISPQVQAMHAYSVVDLPAGTLRLSDMECPQDIDPDLRAAWLARLEDVAMNRYPPSHHRGVDAKLRAVFDLDPRYRLLFGNGSDEFIQMILTAVAAPGRVVLSPAPSFIMYRLVAEMLGMRYVGVALKEDDFSLDLAAMLDSIERTQPAVVFLADPNNPTGNALERHAVQAIIEAAPGLVVLDEAYGPYSAQSNADLMARYDNLLVMRTLSKMGFAGLRFGYLFGSPTWMDELAKVKPPYNVNVLSLASIDFALEHFEFTQVQTAMIRQERARIFAQYQALAGVRVWASQANFLLLRVADADAVQQGLLDRGIWVKNLSHADAMLRGCLRVTISNAPENDRCLAALREVLA